MKRNRQFVRKGAILWLAFAMLAAAISPGHAATAASEVPDGSYAVDYFYLIDGQSSVSVANNYLKEPGQKGTLTLSGGQAVFSHEASVQTYGYFPYLGFRLPVSEKARITTDPSTLEELILGMEGYQAVTAMPVDGNPDRYSLQYEITDITARQDILMHVNMEQFGYNHWYNVQLRIDLSSLPGQPGGGDAGGEPGGGLVTEATYDEVEELMIKLREVHDTAVEGAGYGEYAAGSKAALSAAMEATEAELTEGQDGAAYAAIYNALLAASDTFAAAQRLADRTELEAVMTAVRSFLSKVKRNGETEGAPGSAIAAIHPGEYYASNVDMLVNAMTQAQLALDNPATTPETISQRINGLNSNYQQTLDTQYVTGPSLRIYALDTLETPEQLSIHAEDFSDTVTTVMQKQHAADFMDFGVNLTLRTIPDHKLNQSIAIPDSMPFTAYMPEAGVVSSLSDETQRVYQLQPAGAHSSAYRGWLGLSVVRYDAGGDTRTVYISYNADLLETLREQTELARVLLDGELPDAIEASYAADARAALEAAYDQTAPIAANLASHRPVIREALEAFHAPLQTYLLLYAQPLQDALALAGPLLHHPVDERLTGAARDALQSAYDVAALTAADSDAEGAALYESYQALEGTRTAYIAFIGEAMEERAGFAQMVLDHTESLSAADRAGLTAAHQEAVQAAADPEAYREAVMDIYAAIDEAIVVYQDRLLDLVDARAAFAGILLQQPHGDDQAIEEALAALQEVYKEVGPGAADPEAYRAAIHEAFAAITAAIDDYQEAVGDTLAYTVVQPTRQGFSPLGSLFTQSAAVRLEGSGFAVRVTIADPASVSELRLGTVEDLALPFQSDQLPDQGGRVDTFLLSGVSGLLYGEARITGANGAESSLQSFRINLNGVDNSDLAETVRSARKTLQDATIGVNPGQYPLAAAGTLEQAIEAGELEAARLEGSAEQTAEAAARLRRALQAFRAAVVAEPTVTHPPFVPVTPQKPAEPTLAEQYEQGTYRISFAWQTDDRSLAELLDNHVHPNAKLIIEGQGSKLELTVADTVSSVQLDRDGSLTEIVIVATDPASAERVVSVPVSRASEPLKLILKLVVEGEVQTIRIALVPDAGSIVSESDVPEAPSAETEEPWQESESPAAAEQFPDVEQHWAAGEINRAVDRGLVTGYEDGTFRPDHRVSRAEFAVLLNRALQLPQSGVTSGFGDRELIPSWASDAIERAAAAGIIGGYEDGTFRGERQITRAELAVIIGRALQLETDPSMQPVFVDQTAIPQWAQAYVNAAYHQGLISGRGDGRFDPASPATRAEAVKLILALVD